MKTYKKLLIIILVSFWFFSNNIVNAKIPESCKIKSSPSKELNEYLKNIRKIISNINSNLPQKEINSLDKSNSEALRLWNSIFSWNDYFTEWSFKVQEPLLNNIPRPIIRDNKLLTNEIEKLNRLMSLYAKRWFLDLNINSTKICEWIDNCKISNNIWKALIKIISSTKDLRLLIQKAATDKKLEEECKNIIWISEKKCRKIFNDYLDAKQECVDDNKKESILKIWLNFKYTENWIKKWKDAWALLTWNNTLDNYEEIEKNLLKKELSKQWLSWHQTQQILDNLNEYNWKWWVVHKGFTLNNNPISNITKTILKAVDKNQLGELEIFKKSITELFKNKQKEASISQINQTFQEKKKENISNYNINTVYEQMIPLAQAQDLDTNQIVREIIIMNIEISQANNILDKTIPLSQETCNQQDQWNWNCN